MKTVKEVSQIAGVTVRTLQYYDKIGLLKPSDYSEAGYRLYSAADLRNLQTILLFRELEFPLKEIKSMMTSPGFDQQLALEQQIQCLILKKERLANLIEFAQKLKTLGGHEMDFSAFDTKKLDDYRQQAKEKWGETTEYKEFEAKDQKRSGEESQLINQQLMLIFAEFGKIKASPFDGQEAQALVKKLQDFISQHYYQCSNEILAGLGKMYAAGGEFTQNIDEFAGAGTAVFVDQAIDYYCR